MSNSSEPNESAIELAENPESLLQPLAVEQRSEPNEADIQNEPNEAAFQNKSGKKIRYVSNKIRAARDGD